MDVGAAQFLGADDLAGRGLDQRRTAEKDRPLLLHDDGLVRHRRLVGAAGGAGAHDHGDLRDAERRHVGLVVEDAAEMVAVGKDLVLGRQVAAAGIDQIEAGQTVLDRDFLGPDVLLDRDRVIAAALHRGVVADDDAFPARDPPDPGNDPGRRHVAAIHAVGGELAEFQEGRTGIGQGAHPVPRQQLAARQMAFAGAFRPAPLDRGHGFAQVGDQRPVVRVVRAELRGSGVEVGTDNRHSAGPARRRRPVLEQLPRRR